jgi:hypothetical protein
MTCKQCGSDHVREFRAEINLNAAHFRDLNQQPVMVFPRVWICLRCGTGEFALPPDELKSLEAEARRPCTA